MTGILIAGVPRKGMPAALFMALPGIVVRVPATRHDLQKTRAQTPGIYLCNAGGLIHHPALPFAGIYFFGCPRSG